MFSFLVSMCILFFGIGSAKAVERSAPKLVTTGVSSVFVPLGFDDNDNVQVVIEGYFPNTCYKLGPSNIEVEDEKVKITPLAYFYAGPCLQMMVHYEKAVNLGLLKAGKYRVEISQTVLEVPPLVVKEADPNNATPDDFLYAPIKSASIISQNPPVLRLKGAFTNSCMKMEEVRVPPSYNRTVAVLPIATYKGQEGCAQVMMPFEQDVAISEKLAGRYLFHIRSLNGASVNLIEDL